MSFSFRNVFSPEGDESSNDPANPFSAGGGATRDNSASASGDSSGGKDPVRRRFLLSELLALIPPAIAATSGIPVDDEVELPIPESHGNDIRLSLLYQACPQLFAAEITPLNDSTITLPGKTEEHSRSPEEPVYSGFSSSPKQESEAKEETNPFWTPSSAKVEMKERESDRQGDETASPQGEPNPFSGSSPKSSDAPNPFSQGGMKRGEVEKVPGGFDSPGFESESGAPFEWPPEPVPETNEEQEPEREEEQNPFTSSEGFSTLFSKKAQDDSEIPFPGTENEEATPFSGGEPPERQEGNWGAMFDAPPADEDAGKPLPQGFSGFGSMLQQPSPEEERGAVPEQKEGEPVVSEAKFVEEPVEREGEEIELVEKSAQPTRDETFQPSTEEPAKHGAEHASETEPAGFGNKSEGAGIEVSASVGPLHGKSMETEAETTSQEPFSGKPAESSTPAWLLKPQEEPKEASVESESKIVEPVPASEEKSSAAAGDAPPPLPLIRAGDDTDLILRAIFSTSENFTFSKLARQVVALPGINGCALATPSKLVQASTCEKSRVGDHARDMVSTIRNLATFTGLAEASVFTLHTDKGIVSLFLEGSCCLTVHQDSVDFGPGIREKLTLIARCLQEMKE